MQPQMRTLVQVQETEARLRALEADVTALPKRVSAAEAAAKAAVARVAASETKLRNGEAARRRMEDDVRDQKERIRRLRVQMDAVKTSEQLQALEHEIAFAGKSISDIEDRELASLEEAESEEAALGGHRQASAAAEKALEDERRYVRGAAERLHAELAGLRTRRTELRAAADADMLASYDRIAKNRKTGVAEVVDSQCQGCHIQLRPQRWNSLRGGEAMTCEACGRILYYEEGNDAALARANAGKLDLP